MLKYGISEGLQGPLLPLLQMKQRMSVQQRWSLVLEAVRVSTETICYSAAFLLTGQ
jgi:hypothetical protein